MSVVVQHTARVIAAGMSDELNTSSVIARTSEMVIAKREERSSSRVPTANKIGELFYLGHHAGIKPELTPWENLRFYQKVQGVALSDEALWFALEKVALVGREDLPCSHLSAGQQRRVALAKLWLTKQQLWILDEPFTAIDKKGVVDLIAHIEIGRAHV